MTHELIGAWLDVPPDPWPPDHYTLLGLSRGEGDRVRIERHVQERLEQVRRFQLAHPEQATEAMNRLAQAFVCLSDPRTKQAYDHALLVDTRANGAENVPPAPQVAETPLLLDWREAPPPQRGAAPVEGSTHARGEQTPTLQDAATAEAMPAVLAPAEPSTFRADPDYFRQRLPRGFSTRRAMLERILLTRRMLAAWRTAGTYLSRTKRPLTRPAEATDLLQQMQRIRALLEAFAGILGEAGQPGYLVASLARQPLIVPTIQTLLPSQRVALARDWQNGLELLTALQDFLRCEFRVMRARTGLGRTARAVLLTLRDQPGWILFALGLVALNLLPAFRGRLLEQLVLLVCMLALRLIFWWDSRDTARRYHTSSRRQTAPGQKTRAPRPVR